ncbi:MAG: hypothetical protein JRJ43_02000 [Deltaproteobacteria bacterium]|nr:hypothetical protein [Deltaproteobacteria bacterium]MBW1718324.1 hypothetical protein [Deltaproteobacteria bacterium]MBW2079870.1 hypothetical protein [Deltaproteobacteria bacterium]MBW2349879.1 hypothetical protein [Deltaproteobacteria bacterium]
MRPLKKDQNSRGLLPGYTLVALAVLAVAEVFLFLKVPVVQEYFYILAWWPYIILADGLIYKQCGWSPIKGRPSGFLSLITWSVTIWLIFELFNLRLQNWHYVELVSNPFVRWPGYTLAFATVLPGLFETHYLIKTLGISEQIKTRPFFITPKIEKTFFATGLIFLALPVFLPKYFFPLVWGGFVFLLDPINARMKGPSLLKDLSNGRPQKAIQLLIAGMTCGLLWEFWNFWAKSKWIYTVPFVGDIKLFEMPVLGFLGFPPFALECYVMYNFVCCLGLAIPWEQKAGNKKVGKHIFIVLAIQIAFWFFVFSLIDKNTVHSFH